MIIISNKPAKIKQAICHLLESDGLTCVFCREEFGPLEWDSGSFLYEVRYESEHSTMFTLEPEEDIFYTNCKDLPVK